VGYDDLTDWDPDDDETPPDTAAIEAAYAETARLAYIYPLDPDAPPAEQIAYHEAGHAVAALLCVVGWEEIAISRRLDRWGWTTLVEEHEDDTTPANLAFIDWAGAYAEARYLSPDDPWAVLPEVQNVSARSDMRKVRAYRDDPAHAPHESDEQWARSLDGAWKHVVALAERLARERVVRTPLHPDFEPG
jgi:hypothetical protein